jgi:hypothetical protein
MAKATTARQSADGSVNDGELRQGDRPPMLTVRRQSAQPRPRSAA